VLTLSQLTNQFCPLGPYCLSPQQSLTHDTLQCQFLPSPNCTVKLGIDDDTA
jgi:hypothetical protein